MKKVSDIQLQIENLINVGPNYEETSKYLLEIKEISRNLPSQAIEVD